MRLLYVLSILLFTCLLAQKATADLAIVVHPDNPISSLSDKDVQKIFLGRLRMFPETSMEPQTIDLPDDSALYSRFYARIAQMTPAKVRRYRAFYLFSGKGKVPQQANDQADVISKIRSDSRAIGYLDASADLAGMKVVLILEE